MKNLELFYVNMKIDGNLLLISRIVFFETKICLDII